ncbi:MAG: acyl carrier protein [Planctomycetota bacterium]
MTRDEIMDKLKEVLEDALGVDEDEITPDATLTGDLGAESIDFLDIAFKIEQTFGFKIPQGEMFPEEVIKDPQFVSNGKVTPEGIVELKTRLPHFNFDGFEQDPSLAKIGDVFTVNGLANYVERKLGETASA